jgi:hypothetical protein
MPLSICIEAEQRLLHRFFHNFVVGLCLYNIVVELDSFADALGNSNEFLLFAVIWSKAQFHPDILLVLMISAIEDILNFLVFPQAWMQITFFTVLPVEVSDESIRLHDPYQMFVPDLS